MNILSNNGSNDSNFLDDKINKRLMYLITLFHVSVGTKKPPYGPYGGFTYGLIRQNSQYTSYTTLSIGIKSFRWPNKHDLTKILKIIKSDELLGFNILVDMFVVSETAQDELYFSLYYVF